MVVVRVEVHYNCGTTLHADMKKREVINKKVVQRVVVASVDKIKLMTHINVIQLTLEGEELNPS